MSFKYVYVTPTYHFRIKTADDGFVCFRHYSVSSNLYCFSTDTLFEHLLDDYPELLEILFAELHRRHRRRTLRARHILEGRCWVRMAHRSDYGGPLPGSYQPVLARVHQASRRHCHLERPLARQTHEYRYRDHRCNPLEDWVLRVPPWLFQFLVQPINTRLTKNLISSQSKK